MDKIYYIRRGNKDELTTHLWEEECFSNYEKAVDKCIQLNIERNGLCTLFKDRKNTYKYYRETCRGFSSKTDYEIAKYMATTPYIYFGYYQVATMEYS